MQPFVPARGLYDPCFEHDSCGVGLVCQLDGVKNHAIVADGLKILCNLRHRGVYGCDAAIGDGAGIMMQMPHDFLAPAAGSEGIGLPGKGEYACGAVFFPSNEALRRRLMQMCEAVVVEEGQAFLGWRRVPMDSAALGPMARAVEPVITSFSSAGLWGLPTGRLLSASLT